MTARQWVSAKIGDRVLTIVVLSVGTCAVLLTSGISAGLACVMLVTAMGFVSNGVTLVICVAILMSEIALTGDRIAFVCLLSAAAPTILFAESRDRFFRFEAHAQRTAKGWTRHEEKLRHDLRTPLNGISGAFEMLSRRNLDAKAEKYVSLGMESVASMAALIDGGNVRRPQASGPNARLSGLSQKTRDMETGFAS